MINPVLWAQSIEDLRDGVPPEHARPVILVIVAAMALMYGPKWTNERN